MSFGPKFDEFLHRCGQLRMDRALRGKKPYKPLLVASVVVLIDQGKIRGPDILLDGALRSVFDQLLAEIAPERVGRADIRYPFRHLETDGVWTLQAGKGLESRLSMLRSIGGRARELVALVACAKLDDEVYSLLASSPEARIQVIRAVGKHLPPGSQTIITARMGSHAGASAGVIGEAEAAFVTEAEDLNERGVEELLVAHWEETPFHEDGIELSSRERNGLAGRQCITPVGILDLLGWQNRSAWWWVFELKRGRPSDKVVGQISRYMGWMRQHRCPPGTDVQGVVLAEGGDDRLEYAIRSNPRLSLWLYDSSLAIRRAS